MMRKIKYIPQLIQTECALCCIAMISRYYGNYITLNDLREYLQPGRDGISAKQLCEVLTWIGFDYKIYKGNADAIEQIDFPVILFWNKNHFIVLEYVKNHKFHVVDPALGKVVYDKEEFEDGFSNIIIYTEPNKKLKLKKKEKSIWLNYLFVLKQQKLLIFFIIFFSLLTYVFSLILPILIQKTIDNLKVKFMSLVIASVLVIAGYCVCILVTSLSKVLLKTKLFEKFSKIAYEHLTKVPYSFFDMRSHGNISFSLESIRLIKDLYAEQMLSTITSIGAVISLLVYIFITSRIIFYFVLFLLITEVYLLYITGKRLLLLNQLEISSRTKLKEIQMEFIYSILNIKIAGIEKDIFGDWEKHFNYSICKSKRKDLYNSYYTSISSMMQVILPTIVLFLGIFMVKMSIISFGTALSVYSVSSMLVLHSVNILMSLNSFAMSSQYLNRINDIISQKVQNDGNIEVSNISSIIMNNVSFRYNSHSEMILKNINMQFNAGEKIAIVGGSGSGKSTIAKLLLGLYEPTSGEISFNGISLKDIDKKKLKKFIGMVPQENILFNKSIKDNILIGRKFLDIDDVVKSCNIAMISDEIERMPMKYETLISDTGMNVSGGQKQRLILARAVAGNPQLLVFDEATSSLDSIKEKQIFNNLKSLDSIQIVIAHRLSTIKDSDRIYVIDCGEIVESGNHDELMQKHGKYSQLYNQFK